MALEYLRSGPSVPQAVWSWAKRLIDDLNTVTQRPGPYADDTAAAAANVKIGGEYVDTSGFVKERQT